MSKTDKLLVNGKEVTPGKKVNVTKGVEGGAAPIGLKEVRDLIKQKQAESK